MPAKRYIVLLDDDATTGRQLVSLLGKFRELADVECYREGMEVQRLLAQRPADIVIIDPRLSDCDGLELIRVILNDRPETSVLGILPADMEAYARQVLEAGAAGIMTKPYQAAQVEETIGQALGIRVGLRGAVDGISLADLVQLIHTKKWDRTVVVSSADGLQGRLHFHQGEVIHAETDMLVGIDAFNSILDWPQGRFEIRTGSGGITRTVRLPTMQLLLDGLRRSDEESSKSLDTQAGLGGDDEIGALFDSLMMPTESAAKPEPPAPAPAPNVGRERKQSPPPPHFTMSSGALNAADTDRGPAYPPAPGTGAFREVPSDHGTPPHPGDADMPTPAREIAGRLEELRRRWQLAETCAVVDRNGFVLAGSIDGLVTENFLSQLFGATAAFFEDSASEHHKGEFREAILRGEQGCLVVLTIPGTSCCLVATTKAEARLGLVLSGLEHSLRALAGALQETTR